MQWDKTDDDIFILELVTTWTLGNTGPGAAPIRPARVSSSACKNQSADKSYASENKRGSGTEDGRTATLELLNQRGREGEGIGECVSPSSDKNRAEQEKEEDTRCDHTRN